MNGLEAAALRLASTVRQGLTRTLGTETDNTLTLDGACRVLRCPLPRTEDDLRALALACERAALKVNLDDETGGAWWRMREAAKAVLLDELTRATAAQLSRPVLDLGRACLFCGGRRFGRAHGAQLCHGCGALTQDVVSGEPGSAVRS